MEYTQRLYRGEADYAAMRGLIAASYKVAAPHSYMLLGDLDWWRALLAEPETFLPKVPLWFAGDTLVGFLWPGEGSGDIMLHPEHRAAELLMLGYAEQHLRRPTEDGSSSLMQVSLESDSRRNQLLQKHGFTRSNDFLASHVIDLAEPKPLPQLPAGFTLRDMRSPLHDSELGARVDMHRAAFHPSKFTLSKYLAARNSPTYRPELDLVAVAPSGDFAAYTIVWFEEENRTALFEPVGCHPDYQRRGLGRAVLYEAMRRLRELGADRAHVGSWLDDSPGALLYRAAGFERIDRFYEWHKTYPAQESS
jgi:ribosomal protein S18 acetylase RimI-like enzyme